MISVVFGTPNQNVFQNSHKTVILRACDFIAFLVLGMLEWFCSLGAIDVYRNRVSRVQSADWLLVSGNAVVCPVGPFLCWFSARMMD